MFFIFKGSCDTEDWSDGYYFFYELHFKIENSYFEL